MERFLLKTHGVKILVVDDSQPNLLIAKGILSKCDIAVSTVNNGMDAIQQVEQESFDLVILDRMMPEMDGHETARKIRALPSEKANIPIVLYTSGEKEEFMEEFEDVGITESLLKPLDLTELARLLLKYLKPGKILEEGKVRKLLQLPDREEDFSEETGSSPLRNALAYIEEIDYEAGFAFTGSSDENYLQVLKASCKTMEDVCFRLTKYQALILKGQSLESSTKWNYGMDEIRIDTHSLKGVCASIGLKKLSESSGEMERLSMNHETEKLHEALPAYLDHLTTVFDALSTVILPLSPKDLLGEASDEVKHMDPKAYESLWQNTKKSIRLFDIDDIQSGLNRLLEATEPGEKKQALNRAITCAGQFDYETVMKILNQYE